MFFLHVFEVTLLSRRFQRHPQSGRSAIKIIFLQPNYQYSAAIPSCDSIEEKQVAKLLAQLGADVTWLEPFHFPWNLLSNANPFYRAIDVCRAIWVMLRFRRVDAVVSICESGGLFMLLTRRLFFFKPKIILWDASIGNPWRVVRWIQSCVFPRYDGFMMLTNSQVHFLNHLDCVHGVAQKIGYSIDDYFFHPRHSLHDDYVLTVGDDRSRDFKTFIDAIKDFDYPVVMKTRWRPADMQAIASRNIRFISERLHDRDYRDLYANAAFVVVPLHLTQHPGGITAVFEAMAMGKAVVVTQSPVADDYVQHGHSGIVVPVENVAELSGAIKLLWENRILREEYGRNGRRLLDSTNSTSKFATRMYEVLLEITATKRKH